MTALDFFTLFIFENGYCAGNCLHRHLFPACYSPWPVDLFNEGWAVCMWRGVMTKECD